MASCLGEMHFRRTAFIDKISSFGRWKNMWNLLSYAQMICKSCLIHVVFKSGLNSSKGLKNVITNGTNILTPAQESWTYLKNIGKLH